MSRSPEINALVATLQNVCRESSSQDEARTRVLAEIEPQHPGIAELLDDFRPFMDIKASR